jgi:tetratricopeptide (TPR) repeat protein
MKRSILTGVLVVASGFSALMAQQPAAGAKQPTPKSKAEQEAVVALIQAQQSGNLDGTIKAAEDLLTKFADTEFKTMALYMEAVSYEQKGDFDKAMIFGERVLEIEPNNFQVTLMIGQQLAQRTKENDLDKEEKLGRAEKMLNTTIESLKTAPKPNPQLPDAQWTEAKAYMTAEAHNGLGLAALTRKKYDVAIKEFQAAVTGDPQPAYSVRLASALQQSGKNAEAIAIVDKLLADPMLHPQIKSVATNIKQIATAAMTKK